jgi:hypothetical protein
VGCVSLLDTKNNDFHRDLSNRTVTQFYPSPSGHADRVMSKLAPLGFTLKSPNDDNADDFESEVRRLALKRGYRLMHRRNGNYWTDAIPTDDSRRNLLAVGVLMDRHQRGNPARGGWSPGEFAKRVSAA